MNITSVLGLTVAVAFLAVALSQYINSARATRLRRKEAVTADATGG